MCAGFPETDWSRTFLSTLLMEPPFPLSPERTTCSREFDVTQQGSAREVEHREPGDCQTEKSKAHSLSLPKRFLGYLWVLARAAAQDPRDGDGHSTDLSGSAQRQAKQCDPRAGLARQQTEQPDPRAGDESGTAHDLGGRTRCRKSSETKRDKQVHAVEELPRSSYAPTIRLPMRGATGNCPRSCMVRFPRRQTEQRSPHPGNDADCRWKTNGERKRMCHDGLDALSENDVRQLKTVKVEPMGSG